MAYSPKIRIIAVMAMLALSGSARAQFVTREQSVSRQYPKQRQEMKQQHEMQDQMQQQRTQQERLMPDMQPNLEEQQQQMGADPHPMGR
jgi:hypothetical protein